ncbi:hypothetical protein JCM17380_38250 [Desulfosporosinus burensis]
MAIIVQGTINVEGVLSTIIAIFHSNSAAAVRSGRSVYCTKGKREMAHQK